ncbi:lysine transporter LysE [Pseudoalteromonas luteoviolacea]|uniref:Lysine exporter protein (LYSE/YGGA) n=1 Tax=Pseudoalteromonas luteoviolacea TaxID=43657 RepID=A0A023Q124_9GAMM|nr:LysE family translocator [Pseudoalteromonas luteoviolacea]AHX39837.1 lysine exporter protein (LYSE/YGGA) [Pseudoalteromonas luteoviolacea]KID56114.1 lysine transporter LysE [Pseudoalteromonas luteoviolacea]
MLEAIISLAFTTFLLLGSPGPAPLALAAVGASSGVREGVPFLLGILSGLLVAIVASATGLGALLLSFPQLTHVLQVAALLYLLYVAYKIATNKSALSSTGDKSVGFMDGFILNLFNPKAYAACIAIFANVALPFESQVQASVVAASILFAVAIVADALWLYFGGVLHRVVKTSQQLRYLRLFFASLLVLLLGYVTLSSTLI